jgi:signal transduction histidine kinase
VSDFEQSPEAREDLRRVQERMQSILEVIHRSCLRMEHLITDLLDMASISAGRLSLQTKPEPADEVLGRARDLHQPLAEEKKIALVLRAGSEGVLIECDRQRVMQVFENLIGNALKFCRAGDTVTLASERSGGAVDFSVEDTGPGIQSELLAKLFDPYWSGPGSPSGIGLGLYIARGIVERHTLRATASRSGPCGRSQDYGRGRYSPRRLVFLEAKRPPHPMNPIPITTAFRPATTCLRRASASVTERRSKTPCNVSPGIGGRRLRTPVAMRSLS